MKSCLVHCWLSIESLQEAGRMSNMKKNPNRDRWELLLSIYS